MACSSRVWYIVGSIADRFKPKTIKLVSVFFPLGTQHNNNNNKALIKSIVCIFNLVSNPESKSCAAAIGGSVSAGMLSVFVIIHHQIHHLPVFVFLFAAIYITD